MYSGLLSEYHVHSGRTGERVRVTTIDVAVHIGHDEPD